MADSPMTQELQLVQSNHSVYQEAESTGCLMFKDGQRGRNVVSNGLRFIPCRPNIMRVLRATATPPAHETPPTQSMLSFFVKFLLRVHMMERIPGGYRIL